MTMDMLNVIGNIFKELKELILSRQIFIVAFFIGLGSLSLLILPNSVFEIFYLVDLRNRYIETIGIISYASLFVVVSGFIYYFWNWIFSKGKKKYRTMQKGKGEINLLESLTPVECTYLAEYLTNKSQTAYFPVSDGVAGGLEAKNVLYKSSTIGTVHSWAYNIQPWAYQQIASNPKIIIDKVQQLSKDK